MNPAPHEPICSRRRGLIGAGATRYGMGYPLTEDSSADSR
jgi:hypothetical protein